MIVGLATKCGDLYYLNCQMLSPYKSTVNTARTRSHLKIWHQRYGHLNISSFKKLANEQLVDGLNQSDVSDEMEFCESCVLGKIHRSSYCSLHRQWW